MPFEEASVDLPQLSLRDIEEADLRRQIKEWYDAAPSLEERQKRKTALRGIMYSGKNEFRPEEFLNVRQSETNATDWGFSTQSSESNPKTLTGQQKVPVLSVIPPASILAQATAMRYGAFFAPRVDGKRGYGPYNWRDQPIEAHIYIDAAIRHLMQWWDGDDAEGIFDDNGRHIDEISHLAFALATIGILIDARANGTLIDDRPPIRKQVATQLLQQHKISRKAK